MNTLLLALALGGAFGITLDRIGATNPDYIIRMMNLSDLHLMKTILLGIGVASALMFGGLLAGLVDPGHLSVKPVYPGVLIGGLMLGAGFAVSGFCPGTGLTAAATGRYDAIVFVIGGLVGAGLFMLVFGTLDETALFADWGGKMTLGEIGETGYPALFEGTAGAWIGLTIALCLVIVALLLPDRIGRGHGTIVQAE